VVPGFGQGLRGKYEPARQQAVGKACAAWASDGHGRCWLLVDLKGECKHTIPRPFSCAVVWKQLPDRISDGAIVQPGKAYVATDANNKIAVCMAEYRAPLLLRRLLLHPRQFSGSGGQQAIAYSVSEFVRADLARDMFRHDPQSICGGADRAAAGQAALDELAGLIDRHFPLLAAIMAYELEINGLHERCRSAEIYIAEHAGAGMIAGASAPADTAS
jgi:hypothetical protein